MAEQDNGAKTPTESPQSRLISAGFGRRLEWWTTPGEERVVTMEEAIRLLDSGEVEPYRIPWPGIHPDTAHTFQRSEEEIDRMLGRNQPQPEEAPPLPAWAEPWAELIAAQLKPIIKAIVKAEIRAALKKECGS